MARACAPAAGIPGHSGGSAPDSHRLPSTTDLWTRGFYPSRCRGRRHEPVHEPSGRRSHDGQILGLGAPMSAARTATRSPANHSRSSSESSRSPALGPRRPPPPRPSSWRSPPQRPHERNRRRSSQPARRAKRGRHRRRCRARCPALAALQGCWFEWGIAPGFEASVPCQLGPAEGSFVSASARATGMLSGTTYGWRLAASNAAGVAHGSTASLTTTGFPPNEAQAETTEAALIGGLPGRPRPIRGRRPTRAWKTASMSPTVAPPVNPDSELSPLPARERGDGQPHRLAIAAVPEDGQGHLRQGPHADRARARAQLPARRATATTRSGRARTAM